MTLSILKVNDEYKFSVENVQCKLTTGRIEKLTARVQISIQSKFR